MRTAVHRDVASTKDTDDTFGEYVAGELRELDVNTKRHVKFRIQTVLKHIAKANTLSHTHTNYIMTTTIQHAHTS